MKAADLQDFNFSGNLEWLEANGLGGYASSTVAGANSRRYHGLLVASLHPPVNRVVVVSKLDETLKINGEQFEISSNQYPGAVHPKGYQYLESFEREIFPVFHYRVGGVRLKKTIVAVHGENTTLILYEVIDAPDVFEIELLPLYSCRDIHNLTFANDAIGTHYLFEKGVFRTLNYQGSPEFFITVPGATFTENKSWFYSIEHEIDRQRGLEFREDLFSHGRFTVALKKGDQLGVILSLHSPKNKDAFKIFENEKIRRENLTKQFSRDRNLSRLALAADQFVVKRGRLNTIIAGYHWFSDWGRDTMISLPGLCLVTQRFEDARKILRVFADNMKDGMLPNRFPDDGEAPEYNTIDATLWYFNAVYKYFSYTGDLEFIQTLLPVLKKSIAAHEKGTRYNIHVDPADHLVYGGRDGVQLTWMDAKVGDWVVTPRKGKPVEINALWYNALCIMENLLRETDAGNEANQYKLKAEAVEKSFNANFWNIKDDCLYDCIDGDRRDDAIRPNQIFAVSLPFRVLSKDRSAKVFEVVTRHLLTPRGLRSLSPRHADYKSVYEGGVLQRDGAYHQGTVWSFLMGPYIDALIKVKGISGKKEAAAILQKFCIHLDEAGVGTVSEIFDANEPFAPKGCIAQAWGVAEILRVAVEYDLGVNQKK
jgi:predicted glycogen debranching enzyme